jgi:hypothetical protein
MTSSAWANSPVSYLNSGVPSAFSRQPCFELGTRWYIWIIAKMSLNAQTLSLGRVTSLPSSSSSSRLPGMGRPCLSSRSCRAKSIQANPCDVSLGMAISLPFQTDSRHAATGKMDSIGYAATLSPCRYGVRSSKLASTAWANRGILGYSQLGTQSRSGTSRALRVALSLSM